MPPIILAVGFVFLLGLSKGLAWVAKDLAGIAKSLAQVAKGLAWVAKGLAWVAKGLALVAKSPGMVTNILAMVAKPLTGFLKHPQGAPNLWPDALHLILTGLISSGSTLFMAQARIPIPGAKDALGILELTAAVATGITGKGKDSLIVGDLASELLATAAKVPAALAAHKEAKNLELRLEQLYEIRDNVVAEALPLVQRGSKSLQGNLGKTRLREMGDYGYTVNDSPQAPKPPKAG